MAGEVKPPDPGGRSTSYADRAKMNIRYNQKLKRNVLEIEVEKDKVENEVILSEETMVKLLNKIHLNINSHVEGYQVSYGRKKSKIEVLCKPGLDLEQFCNHESIEVEKGVRTNFIRPAGRKDVEVSVAGLGFNTPDSLVQDYITKFGGKLVTNDVIYGKFGPGPFQGKLNGVRKYRVDFTEANLEMGTFHILDGGKVKIFYRGNKSTCGWCHADSSKCPGGAKAKTCKENGTAQVQLVDHMTTLWSQVGFDPQSFYIPEVQYDDMASLDNLGGDRKVLQTEHFPRQQFDRSNVSESDKYTTLRIRNFPLEMSDEDIVKFLQEEVNEQISISDIKSEKTQYSTNLMLGPGPKLEVIAKAMEVLDFKTTNKTFFEDRKLHAQLYRPLTPEKKAEQTKINEVVSNINKVTEVVNDTPADVDEGSSKIKAAVRNLNKVHETPKLPTQKPKTQSSMSSARKPSLDRHKSLFK